MIKKIIKIFLIIALLFSFGSGISYADSSTNLNDQRINSDNKDGNGNSITNSYLEGLKTKDDISTNARSELGIYNMLIQIAESVKNIFIAIASVYLLIISLKLLFAEGSNDEEFEKFKKGFKWTTAGIIVMQIAFSYVKIIYNKEIGAGMAGTLSGSIVEPLVNLLETGAAFFFIAVMIFAFYKMVTAGGEEEKAKQGKMTVLYALIGFVVIKISHLLVSATYSKTLCSTGGTSCNNTKSLSDGAQLIFTIINWLNGFVGIVLIVMIIYTGAQIIFSNGDDDKIKKAKSSILYIFIGIFILIMNYIILTFFLVDELTK